MREYDNEETWSTSLVGLAYNDTSPNSGLRKYLADYLLPHMTPKSLDENINTFPQEMIIDLFKAFMKVKGRIKTGILPGDASKYYE